MNRVFLVLVFLSSVSLFATIPGFGADDSGPPDFPDVLVVSGTITNDQRKPLKDVELHFFADGREVEPDQVVTTSKAGRYEAELSLPKGTLPGATVELEATKPSFKNSGRMVLANIVKENSDEGGV